MELQGSDEWRERSSELIAAAKEKRDELKHILSTLPMTDGDYRETFNRAQWLGVFIGNLTNTICQLDQLEALTLENVGVIAAALRDAGLESISVHNDPRSEGEQIVGVSVVTERMLDDKPEGEDGR